MTSLRRSINVAGQFTAALLLLLFVHRVWDIAPTHTDDASWRLAAEQGNAGIVHSWATGQGRIFAYVSGTLIYIGDYLQGTTLGSALHFGAFASCFILAHKVLSLYFNQTFATLTAIINLALFALRWEGSMVTTYPLFSWTLGTCFLVSIVATREYAKSGRRRFMLLASFLLLLSLNIHEGASVLFAVLALLSCVANFSSNLRCPSEVAQPWYRRVSTRLAGVAGSRQRIQLVVTSATIVLYFSTYIAWRLSFPTQYAGNSFGTWNPNIVLPVLFSLSASGTVLTDLFVPYTVNFADALGNDGYGVTYKPLKYILTSSNNSTALLVGLIVLAHVFLLSRCLFLGRTQQRQLSLQLSALGVGLLVAFTPVAPVALVGKYQEQFFSLNIGSYVFTPLCHFGWSVVIAAAIWSMANIRFRVVRDAAVAFSAVLIALMGYCGSMKNDAIANDMRRETCRWQVIDHLAQMLPCMDGEIASVVAPRLASGTWFSVVSKEYWSDYLEAKHGISLRLQDNEVTQAEIEQGVLLVDYVPQREYRDSWVVGSKLGFSKQDGRVITCAVAVHCDVQTPSENAEMILAYEKLDGEVVTRRVASLPHGNARNVRILEGIEAIAGTVHISREPQLHGVGLVTSNNTLDPGWIQFGTRSPASSNWRVGTDWVDDCWHPRERGGIWSSTATAKLILPPIPPESVLPVRLEITTLTGMGWTSIPQIVSLSAAGTPLCKITFEKGSGQRIVEFDVPHCYDSGGKMPLSISVDKTIDCSEYPELNDRRELGVMISKMQILPAEALGSSVASQPLGSDKVHR